MMAAEVNEIRVPMRIVPHLDEDALAEVRQRLEDTLAVPFQQPGPPAEPAEPGKIKPAPILAAGGHLIFTARGEWSQVMPGLECRFAGIQTPGAASVLSTAMADRSAIAVLEFRLTPQDERHV
jgi:hypothetical protein